MSLYDANREYGIQTHLSLYLITIFSIYVASANEYPDFKVKLRNPVESKRSFRIFDTFMYNNEAEMLYIRLWRLYNYVDYFIILVSDVTHAGKAKPLRLDPFEEEIKSYSDKIILSYIPQEVLNDCNLEDTWCRERAQRGYATTVIQRYAPNENDVIIVSDADEIPTRKTMEIMSEIQLPSYYKFSGVIYFPYYFHYHQIWGMAGMMKYGCEKSVNDVRMSGNQVTIQKFPRISLTHCSYCFRTIEQYKNKIVSFAHQEFNKPPYNTNNWVFKSHYCREKINSPDGYDEADTDWSELIPNHPLLYFLVDPSFMYDINKTSYSQADLPNLCSRQFNRKPFFGKGLPPKV